MSELAPGSVSLEDDNPSLESLAQTPPAPDTPAEPQQAPPEAPPEPEQEPEGTIVNPNGEKLVPLSALAAKRQEASTAKAALAEKDAEIAALKDKAAKFDQVASDWNRVQPLIQQIQQQQQAPPKPAGPLSPQDAIDYAKDLDLYKADGTPDVDRAQRLAARQQTLAERTAQQVVQPLYQTSAQQQSAANFTTALNFTDKNGVKIDKAVLERVWGMMPAEMSARPEIAGVLYKVAVAEMVQAGAYKTPAAPPPPPQFTESLGGNTNAPKELNAIDRAMMSAGQIKSKDYESISNNFKPGQSNALE